MEINGTIRSRFDDAWKTVGNKYIRKATHEISSNLRLEDAPLREFAISKELVILVTKQFFKSFDEDLYTEVVSLLNYHNLIIREPNGNDCRPASGIVHPDLSVEVQLVNNVTSFWILTHEIIHLLMKKNSKIVGDDQTEEIQSMFFEYAIGNYLVEQNVISAKDFIDNRIARINNNFKISCSIRDYYILFSTLCEGKTDDLIEDFVQKETNGELIEAQKRIQEVQKILEKNTRNSIENKTRYLYADLVVNKIYERYSSGIDKRNLIEKIKYSLRNDMTYDEIIEYFQLPSKDELIKEYLNYATNLYLSKESLVDEQSNMSNTFS